MIDEKKIKKAAIECADEYYSIDLGNDRKKVNREIFTKGANWALREFKKSLWHNSKEEPEPNRGILYDDGYDLYDWIHTDEEKWKDRVYVSSIARWCYISDILPKKGGEQ